MSERELNDIEKNLKWRQEEIERIGTCADCKDVNSAMHRYTINYLVELYNYDGVASRPVQQR